MYEGFDFYSPTNLKSYNLNESMRYQLNVLSTLDVFTRKHSENVANITSKLCKQLHLSKSFTIYCTLCIDALRVPVFRNAEYGAF